LKTTFTNDSARFLMRPSAEVARSAARTARGAWFVGASVVAHAAVLLLWRGSGEAATLRPARESVIEFEVALPALTPIEATPPVDVAPPPAALPPAREMPVARTARPLAPAPSAAAVSAPNPAPAPEPASAPAAPAALPDPSASSSDSPGALPADAGGSLAMRTGAGGGGPLGGGGAGGFGPRAEEGGPAPLVDRRALALAPASTVLLSELALTYHAAGMDSEAEAMARDALKLSPDLVHVRVMLAERALEPPQAAASSTSFSVCCGGVTKTTPPTRGATSASVCAQGWSAIWSASG